MAGGIVLLGFLAVVIGTHSYTSFFRQRLRYTPGEPVVTVLGRPFEVTWKDAPVSDLKKPYWNRMVFVEGTAERSDLTGSKNREFTQQLLGVFIPSKDVGEDGRTDAFLQREVIIIGEVSPDGNQYEFGSMTRGFEQVGNAGMRMVGHHDFNPQTRVLRIGIGWAFPQQTTGKTCELSYRLTPEGFVFVKQEYPNASPVGDGGS